MLEKKITEDLKKAMKDGDKLRVSTLRLIISEIKNKKIQDIVKDLDDDKTIGVIQKMARQHKESIEQFKKGNRNDLVQKEEGELAILESYLPAQMSEEEVEKVVNEVIASTGASSARDMGKVMPEVMSRLKGQADGKLISAIVKNKLG